ncbi:NAD(P)H-hydrate epimerase [Jannaschia sp. CCS1]|uniref:NAD(P)H-hydrate epimerase n=1 Tax=Jannaschia sp. (strain CCS1) TaxID=290400 RepID=UPI000053C178|nr:NAD(P)H-hydrate epimerase [Jannaschia sp. CCS1]ABD54434.1 YjeF-related protein-like protein [Jannaschia sp. CCS1]
MTELVTAAEMRAIEADAIASGEVTGLELMERAGRGVVDAILRQWPDAQSATVLCGPGNNGGDGYVIARLLAERWWNVRVLGMGQADAMPPDARASRLAWTGEVLPLDEATLRRGPPTDIYVDAIFGTGLTRAPEGDLASLLRYLGGSVGDSAYFTPRLVAVDAPSGLCLDRGQMLAGGRAEPGTASVPLCALTVTFEVPKIGHFIADGPACCGRLEVVDLGLLPWRSLRRDAVSGKIAEARPATVRVELVDTTPMVPPGSPLGHSPPWFGKRGGHKYDHGHVLVASGGAGRTGAARLAARSALRVGAGLVTVASPPSALMENAMHLTAIMTRRCDGAVGLAEILEDARFSTICLGPGLGVGGETCAMVKVALNGRRQVVLDADALTSFADDPDALFDAIHRTHGSQTMPRYATVLTPHGGEFRRLFPDIAEMWQPADPMKQLRERQDDSVAAFKRIGDQFAAYKEAQAAAISKVEATRAAAKRSGAVVLLKGPDTIVAAPNGRVAVAAAAYERAVPWLATAGAGDVLAGLIAGLAARSHDVFRSAADAAWLHVEAARAFGPGLIAEDLPEILPTVFRELGV